MAFDETYDEPEYTEVLVKSLDPGHPVELRYAHAGDAGADLVAAEDVTLKPFQRALVPTGMAIALPAGYVALVHPRSGLAVKYGVTVLNAPGTIDAGYRGEVKVPLINLDPEHTMEFHRGDRIAQLVIQRYVEARFVPGEHPAGFRPCGTRFRLHRRGILPDDPGRRCEHGRHGPQAKACGRPFTAEDAAYAFSFAAGRM